MKEYSLILLLMLGDISFGERTFRFVNRCTQTIWMGVDGQNKREIPMNGGFEVGIGETKEIHVPDQWSSGRFWPRTGCKEQDGKFSCRTGDCNSQKECNGIEGKKPTTIAEFTLRKVGSDTYALSNIDGHSIGMSIKPIDGKHERIESAELGKYNCGNPTCTFDLNKCPEELKVYDGTGNVVCQSICVAIHDENQRERSYHLKKIFENEDTRSLVCCSADKNYDRSPLDELKNKTKCLSENWPRSTDNQRYDEVFKLQCPDAYSWPFDGQNRTYQCKNAHYQITLCPGTASATVAPPDPHQQLSTNDTNQNGTEYIHTSAEEASLGSLVKQSQFDCIFADLEQGVRVKRWNGLKEAVEMIPTFKLANENEVMIFFAHVLHETDGLKTLEEYCGKDGSCMDKYQGGAGTWCTQVQPAEGKKYFGRGWFQLSWPCNYAEAGRALGVDLLSDPDQVAQSDKLAAATALWYWKEKKMSEAAKQGLFGASTKILNALECGTENERQKKRVQKYHSVRKCFAKRDETNNLMC